MGIAKKNVNVLVQTHHEGEQYSCEQCDYSATEAFFAVISNLFMMVLNKVVHVKISMFMCKLAINEGNIVVTNVTLRLISTNRSILSCHTKSFHDGIV